MTDTLTEAELALMKDLQQDCEHAQGCYNRYANRLVAKYHIGAKDTLDIATGVITRAPQAQE